MEKVNFIYNNNKDVQVPIGTMGAPPFVPRFVFVRFPSNEFALFGQVKSNVVLIVCLGAAMRLSPPLYCQQLDKLKATPQICPPSVVTCV